MNELPEWKELELLVAKIQKQLAPGSLVTHNERIVGKITGVERQIDVSVRSKVGQFDLFIAIDCKDYAGAADVKDVEEFLGLIEDVGADKGALVCPKGFSGTAKTRAERAGIDLLSPVDTDPHKWQVRASVPTICDFRSLHFQLQFSVSAPAPFRIGMDATTWEVFDAQGHSLGRAVDLIRKKWNDGEFGDEPREGIEVDFIGQPALMENGFGQKIQVHLTAILFVEQSMYFGFLSIQRISGFKNELTGAVITNALTTGKLDFEEVEEKWQRIEGIDDAPRRPTLLLTASDVFVME